MPALTTAALDNPSFPARRINRSASLGSQSKESFGIQSSVLVKIRKTSGGYLATIRVITGQGDIWKRVYLKTASYEAMHNAAACYSLGLTEGAAVVWLPLPTGPEA